jgi:hypothetical protein
VNITDSAQVAAYARALSPMRSFQPNHPSTSQGVVVILTFTDRVIGGQLQAGSNGTPLYHFSEYDHGWVFGTSQVPNGAAVFALIAQQTTPVPKVAAVTRRPRRVE